MSLMRDLWHSAGVCSSVLLRVISHLVHSRRTGWVHMNYQSLDTLHVASWCPIGDDIYTRQSTPFRGYRRPFSNASISSGMNHTDHTAN
jgi:hypothetical protein